MLDSTTALELPDVPNRLLVVGGGYIGLELGTVYAALGSKVTVVEMTDGLLPGADRDLAAIVAKRMATYAEAILLETKVTGTYAGGYAQGGIIVYGDDDNYVKLDAVSDVNQTRVNRFELRSDCPDCGSHATIARMTDDANVTCRNCGGSMLTTI